MKLPRMRTEITAPAAATQAVAWVATGTHGRMVDTTTYAVSPMLNFGCLLGCGVNALPCIRCGTDIGCWLSCAGPSTVSCVQGCF